MILFSEWRRARNGAIVTWGFSTIFHIIEFVDSEMNVCFLLKLLYSKMKPATETPPLQSVNNLE